MRQFCQSAVVLRLFAAAGIAIAMIVFDLPSSIGIPLTLVLALSGQHCRTGRGC